MEKTIYLIGAIKKFLHTTFKNHIVSRENSTGSVLVMIIVAIVIIATLSAAMLTGVSSLSFTQLGSVDTMNGFFLAEAGKTYAVQYLLDDMQNNRDPDNATLGGSITLLDDKTFYIPNTNQKSFFTISLSHDNCGDDNTSTTCTYHLKVTGSSTPDTQRTVTYKITQDM